MNDEFSKEEIVELILNFCWEPTGYFKKEENEPEFKKFKDKGFCDYCEEKEKYLINNEGQKYLYPYVYDAAEKFANVVKEHERYMEKDAINWFKNYFELKDIEQAKDILEYIFKKELKIRYKISICYVRGGKGYIVTD